MSCPRIGHGMTPREADIMELWDQGLGADAIAARLGRDRDRVMSVIAIYHDGDGHFDRNVIAGSDALLAALKREALVPA